MLPDQEYFVDAHHHLWDLQSNYYPWLVDRVGPRMYGDYRAIRRDYLVSDFLADIGALPVRKSVHVQAEHDASDPVRETHWLQAVADHPASGGFPHAIVAYADLKAPARDVEAVLAAHCAHANVRGIRQMVHQALVPGMHEAPDYLADATWCTNLALLADHGLSFDLQIFPEQVAGAARIVARNPRLQFVLVHAGQPRDQGVSGLSRWKHGLRQLAALPNVAIKLSGFGMFDRHWSVATLRPLLLTAIDCFGPQRVMFGSNFPVDGLMYRYEALWSAYKEITADLVEIDRAALMHATAERIYRI